MVKILNSFVLFLVLFDHAFAITCPENSLVIKITSTPKVGNRESGFVEGSSLIEINGTGIPFYDDGSARLCKQQENSCSNIPVSVIGCLPKKVLHTSQLNKFTFNITNQKTDTYVNLVHDVILNPGTVRELYLWQGVKRVGTYPNHAFYGETQKSFSYIVLTTKNGSGIMKSQSAIGSLIELVKNTLDTDSKYYDEILLAEDLLSKLSNKSIFEIDLSALKLPNWFKEIINAARDTNEKLKGDLNRKITELENEAKKLADQAKTVLKKLDVSLEDLNGNNCEFDNLKIEDFDKTGEDSTYPSDNNYSRHADSVIARLADLWGKQDRVGFLRVLYAWQQQHEQVASIIDARVGLVPGERNAFLLGHNRVLQGVRQYMDERLYFHSSKVPESTKDAIDYSIAKRSPEIGMELKIAVNSLKNTNEKTEKAFKNIEDLALGYQDSTDSEKPFWDRIGHGLAIYIKGLAENAGQIADCLVKSVSVGPYAEFYELTHGKSFCDGGDLDSIDLAISAGSLSMSAAGMIFGPGGATIGSSLGKGLSVVKKFLGRVLRPFSKAKIDKALDAVGSASLHSIELRKIDALRLKNNPLKNIKYSPKVQDQMLIGDYHSFPKEVDNFSGLGTKKMITGGDGIARTKIELAGVYDAKKGHFEWIIEPDGITVMHRIFVQKR